VLLLCCGCRLGLVGLYSFCGWWDGGVDFVVCYCVVLVYYWLFLVRCGGVCCGLG